MFKKDIVRIIRPGKGGLPPRAAGMVGPLPNKPKKPSIPAAGIMGPRHKKP